MKSKTYNYRREGTPATGIEDLYAFAQERYRDLLREAEVYRVTHDARLYPSASGQARLPFVHLVSWAKMQLTALTHAA